MTVVVAMVTDLMDRSRITAAIDGPITFVRRLDADTLAGADVVLVDLTRLDDVGALRAAFPNVRIVAFGPHVDDESLDAARGAGFDVVVARSQFFRDPAGFLDG
jgi:hypothetical protein